MDGITLKTRTPARSLLPFPVRGDEDLADCGDTRLVGGRVRLS